MLGCVMLHACTCICTQGLASLTVNDRNKELITAKNGVEILAEVLFGRVGA
jgi:hypothetical protein